MPKQTKEDIILQLAAKKTTMSAKEAQLLIKKVKELFDELMKEAGFLERDVRRITTKFRDAGRRSAPWKPASSKVPGRPQDGRDGNRINRWLMDKNHKFYADEVIACLVEVKYYLQALSMDDAPHIKDKRLCGAFKWLLGSEIEPGLYRDPIQRLPVSIKDVLKEARSIQSGHVKPLDRGGIHEPDNAFLMLARSNQLQGNLTIAELLDLMKEILHRHANTD